MPIKNYADYLKRDFFTHRRHVQDLFKRMARNEECFYSEKYVPNCNVQVIIILIK